MKKDIWLEIILALLTITSSSLSAVYRESKIIIIFATLTIVFLLAFLSVLFRSFKAAKTELKKKNKQISTLLAENKKLRKEMCKGCKMIYTSMCDKLSTNPEWAERRKQ